MITLLLLLLLLLGVFVIVGLFTLGKLATLMIASILLFAISSAGFSEATAEAQQVSAQARCIEIEQAAMAYQLAHGAPPSSLAVLANPDPANGNEAWIEADRLLDPWHRPFVMSVEAGKIRVISYGADGKPGGTGLDADIGREGAGEVGH
jgi:general secretion pathway protein G